MKMYRYFIVLGLLLIATALVVGVQAQDGGQENPQGEPPTFLREYYDQWVASPHADVEAAAFHRWDEDGVVEVDCAQCHSTPGYVDYLGGDGSPAGTVEVAPPVGTVVNCDACHNPVASSLTTVSFPSGVEVTNLSDSTRCMVCHQGRASGLRVEQSITDAGLTDLNTVSADLRFINIHYYAAAASLYGSEVHAGYEFPGKSYQPRNNHVPEYDTCIECHNPHTLELKITECAACHEDVESVEDLADVRMNGSLHDYDGDGDLEEGIKGELDTLKEMTYAAIQAYATNVAGKAIIYDEARYPYFFGDANANGTIDEDETNYDAWTGLLLQAAYNYQVTIKDPGGYTHNPKYHIELLYDTLEALNTAMGVDGGGVAAQVRNDPGHFDGTALPFHYWDAEGEVPGTCARCHTAGGLPTYLKNGTNIAVPPSASLECSTCHNAIPDFTVYEVAEVTFPSGAKVSFEENDPNNLCISCHQGRESTVSVNRAITAAGVGDDEVSDALTFRNIHYFAAGATFFGGEVQGAYQYDGKEYNGRNEHVRSFNTCNECHEQHQLTIQYDLCIDCHESVEEPEDVLAIRMEDEDVDPVDYDGDGNTDEPIRDEIATYQEALLAAIQSYATNTIGTAIAYSPTSYPYWMIDLNGNGVADPEEANRDNRYVTWTPNLLRAAYNYQYSVKDPGVFAHNPDYILQVLYDSLEAIGGPDAVATFTRAPVKVAEDD
ncbi:MAG: hypothetical protein BroJett018_02300 [Chloroflexota bacterium]|nr:hypothetical protein [Chloroflexota bacterium]NOG61977.1 hypothetical protein [Chloroflexota bacterium]GIK62436.1 MAG: hypothetical protein BroJett018_02300 [Chloroflexota bacterium]